MAPFVFLGPPGRRKPSIRGGAHWRAAVNLAALWAHLLTVTTQIRLLNAESYLLHATGGHEQKPDTAAARDPLTHGPPAGAKVIHGSGRAAASSPVQSPMIIGRCVVSDLLCDLSLHAMAGVVRRHARGMSCRPVVVSVD